MLAAVFRLGRCGCLALLFSLRLTLLLYALLTGVEMGLIDPERYLPVARKGIAALREKGSPCAADTLEEGFGVL